MDGDEHPHDEISEDVLRERLQRGALSRERLALAGALGHRGAAAALG